MSSPMEQFDVKTIIPLHIGEYDISFTNSSLFMMLAVVSCSALFGACLMKRTIVPQKGQAFAEMVYDFIHGLVKNNVGTTFCFGAVPVCLYDYISCGSCRSFVVGSIIV